MQRSENIEDLNSTVNQLEGRYLIPVMLIALVVFVGGVVFYYYLKKKARQARQIRSTFAPQKRQATITVIEEVDEESSSSSGIEITVGRNHNTAPSNKGFGQRITIETDGDIFISTGPNQKQDGSIHSPNSSYKTEILNRKMQFDDMEKGQNIPSSMIDKMSEECTQRNGKNLARLVSSERAGLDTGRSGGEESAGVQLSQRTLLLGQDAFNPGRGATMLNRLRTSR